MCIRQHSKNNSSTKMRKHRCFSCFDFWQCADFLKQNKDWKGVIFFSGLFYASPAPHWAPKCGREGTACRAELCLLSVLDTKHIQRGSVRSRAVLKPSEKRLRKRFLNICLQPLFQSRRAVGIPWNTDLCSLGTTYCHMSLAPWCVEHRGFPLGTTLPAEAVLPIASQRPPEISINLFLKLWQFEVIFFFLSFPLIMITTSVTAFGD